MDKGEFFGGVFVGVTLLCVVACFAVPPVCKSAYDNGVRSVYMEAWRNGHGEWEIKADELEFTWKKVVK
jgi:hypothetical protein